MWVEFPLDKGAVNSRSANQLKPGEFTAASGVRYKPNSAQLHNDLPWEPWQYRPDEFATTISNWLGPWYLSFENADDWIMMLGTQQPSVPEPGTNAQGRIYFARADGKSQFELSSYRLVDNIGNGAYVGVTDASLAHWGDRYYLATNQGCVEIAPPTGPGPPTVGRLGFLTPDGKKFDSVGGSPENSMLFVGASEAEAFTGFDTGQVAWTGSTTDVAVGDRFDVFITEYSTVTGIESQPIYYYPATPGDQNYPLVIFPESFLNSDADSFRCYVKYWGNGSSFSSGAELDRQLVRRYEAALVGAGSLINDLRTEFTEAEAVSFTGFRKSAITAPLPVIAADARAIYPAYRHPNASVVGVVWNDSLLAADSGFDRGDDPNISNISGKQRDHTFRKSDSIPTILRYSPPGEPWNQPVPYFLNFASEKEDAIKGLLVVNDRLLVLCDNACHTVRYLPFNNLLASQQGRVKDVLTTNVGLASPKGAAKIETMRGEMAVWVSHRGLEWTDGTMWDDACRDFKIPEGADPSKAILVNMSSEYRLDLYLGKNLYSFYYHPDHLKEGRLKMLGPTELDTVVTGACEHKGVGYRFDGVNLYSTMSDSKGGEGYVYTGHVTGTNPFKDLVAEDLALTHSGSNADFSLRADGAVTGNEISYGNTVLLQNPQLEETGSAGTSQRGNYLRFWFSTNGFNDDWAIGPAWLNMDQESGGLG